MLRACGGTRALAGSATGRPAVVPFAVQAPSQRCILAQLATRGWSLTGGLVRPGRFGLASAAGNHAGTMCSMHNRTRYSTRVVYSVIVHRIGKVGVLLSPAIITGCIAATNSGQRSHTAAGFGMPALHARSSASRISLRESASTPSVASRLICLSLSCLCSASNSYEP